MKLWIAAPLLLPIPSSPPWPTGAAIQAEDKQAEFGPKFAEAGKDPAKLWELHAWCEENGLAREARLVLRAIVEANGDRKAHELLGEIEYDGQWFASPAKVEAYKRTKLEEEAKATGKAVFDGRLVEPADVPFLERGLMKLESGAWVSAEDYEKSQQGWVRQDLEWVPPTEAENIGKGLYRCGEQWLGLEEADAYHANLGTWWKLKSEHYVVYATTSRDLAERAMAEAERVWSHFERAVGVTPAVTPMLLVLNSFEQYNEFAGDPNTVIELRGFSSLHGAFLAEAWPEPYRLGLNAAGVCYWDTSDPATDAFGRTWVRHAAGQAYLEGVDPSPRAISGLMRGEGSPDEFWTEKRIPAWFRYGVATYGERYFADPSTPEEEGGPYGLRNWSIGNIANKGGLDPLERIFEFELTLDDINASSKLINEAGLLVAFVLDGECKPVMAKHLALKEAIKQGQGVAEACDALEQEIIANESALRQFAGL
jgi:hypothetical protein